MINGRHNAKFNIYETICDALTHWFYYRESITTCLNKNTVAVFYHTWVPSSNALRNYNEKKETKIFLIFYQSINTFKGRKEVHENSYETSQKLS